jgi:hypothetical protein
MKNSMKFWMIVAMVLIGATLLVSGNASAVIVAPQPSITVIGTMPVASPVFGSGIASGVLAPRPVFGQPFVQPFFPFFRPFPFFNPFNPFFNEEPFFGFGVNAGFVD